MAGHSQPVSPRRACGLCRASGLLWLTALVLLPGCESTQRVSTPAPTRSVTEARAKTAEVAGTLHGLAQDINSKADAIDDVVPPDVAEAVQPLTDGIRHAGGEVAKAGDDLTGVGVTLGAVEVDIGKIAKQRDTADARATKAEKSLNESFQKTINTWGALVVVAGVGLIALAAWLGFTGAMKGAIGLGVAGLSLIACGCLMFLIARYAVWIGVGAGAVLLAVAGYMAYARLKLEKVKTALDVTVSAIEENGEAVKPVVARMVKDTSNAVRDLIDKAAYRAEEEAETGNRK